MVVAQILVNGIIAGLAYALFALGFGLAYNTTRIFNFAHGAVYTLAAYSFYTFFVICGWHVALSAVLSLGVAAAAGIAIDEIFYRPLIARNTSLLIPLLSSLGLYIVIVNAIAAIYGNENKTLSPGLQSAYTLGPIILTQIQIGIAALSIILFGALMFVLRKTKLGKVLRAMRDDPDLLTAMGVSQRRVRMVAFGIGSGLSACAAILLALDVGIDPNIGMGALLTGAVAVIIGGVGIFEGAAIGALTLGILQSLIIWRVSSRWAEAIAFLVLIVFLIFRPQGIVGKRRRVEEISV
jgi:branched-chain amino acid transport system permease protein